MLILTIGVHILNGCNITIYLNVAVQMIDKRFYCTVNLEFKQVHTSILQNLPGK